MLPIEIMRRISRKYTEGIYRITVTYVDHNLELQTFETDGKDLKEVLGYYEDREEERNAKEITQ